MKTYTIQKTAGLSLEQLYSNLSVGGRIITYGYCISIVALTFRLTSTPYFIRPGEKLNKYAWAYNLRSMLFGWWGIPWGPIYTIDMLKINRKHGGIDITDEILEKIKEQYSPADENKVLEEDLTVEYSEHELVS